MSNKLLGGALLFLLCSCRSPDLATERIRLAEQFFRGVYSGDPTVVDDLASAEVVVSYPIFEKLFGTSAIKGRKAVKDFAVRFGKKWADPRLRVHEAVSDADRVVVVWSFQARDVESSAEHAWGGISVFRFDEVGKIVAEFGEESEPGPFRRLTATPD